jgi:CHASE3 domain sensor protein
MRQWVDHSYHVMEKIDHLSASITQLESDTRGWLLTHNETFMNSALRQSEETHQILHELSSLTADNPKYQQQLTGLSKLISEKVQFHLSQLKGGQHSASESVSPIDGKALMDSISYTVQQLRNEEGQLLQVRATNDRAFVSRGFITTLAGTIAALLFITIILWQLNTDIQRRKRAERQLQQFQFRLQAILDNIPLMIQVKDMGGKYLLVNKKLKETFSFTDEMLLGKTDYQLDPENAPGYEQTDNQAIETGKPVDIDETVTIKN